MHSPTQSPRQRLDMRKPIAEENGHIGDEDEDEVGDGEKVLAGMDQVKEETTHFDEKEKEKDKGIPYDRGYSWLIVVSIFMSNAFTLGHIRALSALFIDISQEFSASTTITSLTFSVNALSAGISSLINTNLLVGRIEVRTLCFVASLLNALVTIGVSFAPNIIVWLILYTIKGFVQGALLVTPTSLVGFYFKKRRNLASSIASTGLVIAYLAFPPFASFLRMQFGFRGALFIIAGLEMNLIASSLLLRPPSSYKKPREKLQDDRSATRETQLENHNSSNKILNALDKPRFNTHNGTSTSNVSTINNWDEKHGPSKIRHHSAHSDGTDIGTGTLMGTSHERQTHNLSVSPMNTYFLNENSDDRHRRFRWQRSRTDSVCLSISDSVFDVVSVNTIPYDDEEDSDVEEDRISEPSRKIQCQLSSFIDISLFKLWTFRMMIVYQCTGVLTALVVIYVPTLAYHAGTPKTDAAFLLTIAGCMDLIVRIAVGYIADKKWIAKEHMLASSMAVIAIVVQFTRFYNTFPLLVMYSIFVGIFTGFRLNLLYCQLLDYFGVEKAAKALGILVLFGTLTASSTHPILGAMTDSTGNFNLAMHYVGAVLVIAVISLLTYPICKRWDEENERKAVEKAKEEEADKIMLQDTL